MSIEIPKSLLSVNIRKKLISDLTLNLIVNGFNKGKLMTFDVSADDKNAIIPFGYAMKHLRNDDNVMPNYFSEKRDIPRYSFTGTTLTELQEIVGKEALEYLEKDGSIMICLATGLGKTCLAINLSSKLSKPNCKKATMVLCNRIKLIEQWLLSINRFCPTAVVQVVETKTKMDKDADFYIMNVMNVTKRPNKDYDGVGLLIVDESNLLCTAEFSISFRSFRPVYTIGLTATPDRDDGLDQLQDFYFGEKRIIRKMNRPFNAYTMYRKCNYTTRMTAGNKLDWSNLIAQQCDNSERNTVIVDICRFFITRTILVMCKRIDQAKEILTMLKKKDEDVDIFIATQKKFDFDSRILVSTFSKSGVGFDHPRLDMIIIASDVEAGIQQYIGRVFRRDDTLPIIVDMVDGMRMFGKHHETRKKCYIDSGGFVKKFEESFPEFESWRKQK